MEHQYTSSIFSSIININFNSISLFSTHENNGELIPLNGYDNVPIEEEKKKIPLPLKKKLTKDEPLLEHDRSLSPTKIKKSSTENNNYVNVGSKKISSPKRTQLPDDDAPILMPKQHTPMKKSLVIKQRTIELVHSEHYKLPPKDEDEDYQPPLPPKQRHQNNTSRAMVYDFIGSELQELRVALAQFDGNSSSKLINTSNFIC